MHILIQLSFFVFSFNCVLANETQFFNYITIKIYRGDVPITLLRQETVITEPEVTEVIIENEPIRVLKTGTFRNLTKLKYIRIRSSALETLESFAFQDVTSLRTIDLSFNMIKEVPINVFANLTVSKLVLKGNGIDTISISAFYNLTYLRTLDLSSNNILEMPMLMFDLTRNLRIVDLSFNRLNQYPSVAKRTPYSYFEEPFYNINEFEPSTIDLSFNNFSYIASYMFRGLSCIGEIKLNNNNVRKIDERAFEDLRCLKSLDLEGNDLQEISDRLLKVFAMAETLNLANNPWTNTFVCKYELWCESNGRDNTMDVNCSYYNNDVVVSDASQ